MSETTPSNAQGPKPGLVRIRLNRSIPMEGARSATRHARPGATVHGDSMEGIRMMGAGQCYDVGPTEAIRRIIWPLDDPDAVIDRTGNRARPIPYSNEPWTRDEWHDGILPCDWAVLRNPKTFQDIVDKWSTIVVAVDSPVNWLRRQDYWQPVFRMQEHLRSDLKAGLIDLGSPPEKPHENAAGDSKDAREHVIDHMIFGPVPYFRGNRARILIYPADRFATPDDAKLQHGTIENKVEEFYNREIKQADIANDFPGTDIDIAKKFKEEMKYKGDAENLTRRIRDLRQVKRLQWAGREVELEEFYKQKVRESVNEHPNDKEIANNFKEESGYSGNFPIISKTIGKLRRAGRLPSSK